MKISFRKFIDDNDNTHKPFLLKSTDVIKLSHRSRYTSKIANSAMKNEIIPYPEFEGFTLVKSRDWETTNKNYGKTYQLYIHSLRFVNELLLNYQSTKDSKYLLKANKYIDDWIEYALKKNNNNMIWYDHAVAQRTQVLIYFLYLNNHNKEFNYTKYGKVLEYHGLYLAEYAKYNRTNHGLMMDRSLMLLGILFEDTNFFNVGYYRSIDTFWYSFSYKGVHLENSPGYHKMVTKMYNQIEKFLNSNDRSYGEIVNSMLKQAETIQDLITLPTGYLPTIGDTRNKIEVQKSNFSNLSDHESGITIFQNKKHQMYISFIAGYSSITHKHFDDLSITYMFKGKSFLVDPGLYNYSRNPFREYIKSAEAHSSLSIKNQSYPLLASNKFSRKVRTDYYKETNDIVHVKGINEDYESANLSRHILLLKDENLLIIVDEINSDKEIETIHNFNLDTNVDVSIEGEGYKLENDGVVIQITDFNMSDEKKVMSGDSTSENIIAINSSNFNEFELSKQIKYKNRIQDENLTRKIFAIHDSLIDELSVHVTENLLTVSLGQKNYLINL